MTRRLALLIALLAAVWGLARPAMAASCSFTITNVDFGLVDTLSGGAVNATATLAITCSNVITGSVRICPNIGAGSGGASGGVRYMRDSSNRPLSYTLSTDLGGGTLWGTVENLLLGTPPTIDLNTSLFGSISTTRTIYVQLLGGQQSAHVGEYISNFTAADVKISYSELNLFNCLTLASPSTATFRVRAEVGPRCLISAQPVHFSPQGVLDGTVDAAGSVNVTCTPGTSYTVALDNGLTGSGPAARRMTLGANWIGYGLYRDAARSLLWGSGAGQTHGGTGTGAAQPVTVYGRVPAQQTPPPGVYTDTVVATIIY